MYFPNDNTKLDTLPRELDSLGNIPEFLLIVKKACSLPADPAWTELDDTLKMYIDAAEEFIDNLVVFSYRPRSFVLYLSPTYQNENSASTAVSMCGQRFRAIRLPKAPVSEESIVISFLEDDDTDYTPFTDYRLIGVNSLTPEIVFSRDVTLPSVTQPYPVKVEFSTVADKENVIQKLAIVTLSNFFFKNPEAMTRQNVTGIAEAFWDLLARLGAGRYA